MIDAVHDLLEGVKRPEETAAVFIDGFTNGGSGVWEQTGSWIRKLSSQYPDFGNLWREFCNHRSWKVRFRAASFLHDMPPDVFAYCFPILLADASARVRSKAAADRYQSKDAQVRAALAARLAVEQEESVKESINFALTYEG